MARSHAGMDGVAPCATTPTSLPSTELPLEPGDVLHLTHMMTGYAVTLIAEPQQSRGCLLALPARPYDRLQVARQRQPPTVLFKYTKGSLAALWRVVAQANREGSLRHVRIHPASPEVAHLALALDQHGEWHLSEAESVWQLETASIPSVNGSSWSASEQNQPGSTAVSFARDGYFVLHELIASDKVRRALRFLNHHLGSADLAADIEPDGLGMEYVRATANDLVVAAEEREVEAEQTGQQPHQPPQGVVKLGKGHTCTCCLAQADALLTLLDEHTREHIARAMGSDSCARRLSGRFGVQVALRFPVAPFATGVTDGDAALPRLLEAAGLDWHTDAAKYNEKKSFDVVVGIFLSEVGAASDGALFVRPGSHVSERQARQEGRLARGMLHSEEADVGTAFTTGAEQANSMAPRAQPILCKPGSVIVFDRDLLHAGGPNLSSDIRYALYARMRFEPGRVCD